MSRICLRTIRLASTSKRPLSSATRCIHSTTPTKTTTAAILTTPEFQTSTSRIDTTEAPRRSRFASFMEVLESEEMTPGSLWASYVDLLHFVRPDQIPLEVHQTMLRRCTGTPEQAREDLGRRIETKRKFGVQHIHETRFQTVIRHMRQAGHIPAIEDYEFILHQFAAVGHHVGALQVLNELTQVGLEKSPKTYGLCFLALARRLTLPCWHENREQMVTGVTRTCSKLLSEMHSKRVPMPSINVDLAFRVVKEALDYKAFERLMKLAYGIDLAYPDRPTLDFWEQPSTGKVAENVVPFSKPQHHPFSIHALNTTLSYLGDRGRISKLVQAFEVLTQPLPTLSTTTDNPSYPDEDDEDVAYDPPSAVSYKPPHVIPNTESYVRLIRAIADANNGTLARHYLLQAIHLDKSTAKALHNNCQTLEASEVPAPQFMLSTHMIRPVFSLANRQNKRILMRWCLFKTRQAKRRRRADVLHYEGLSKAWGSREQEETHSSFSDVTSAEPQPATPSPSTSRRRPSETVDLKLDVDTTRKRTIRPPKKFDIVLHLRVLRQTVTQLEELERHILDVLGRNTQRIKERLGRRVWKEKDVYLSSSGARQQVSREQWREIVNYRATRAVPEDQSLTQERRPKRRRRQFNRSGQAASQFGFFTPSTSQSSFGRRW